MFLQVNYYLLSKCYDNKSKDRGDRIFLERKKDEKIKKAGHFGSTDRRGEL